MSNIATRQDFAVIKSQVSKIANEEQYKNSCAFPILFIETFFGIDRSDADDAMTDGAYLKSVDKEEYNNTKAHDRGIDAIIIDDDSDNNPKVHFFNFKYTDLFENINSIKTYHEVDKVVSFFSDLLTSDREKILQSVNSSLAEKIREIQNFFDKGKIDFSFHFACNYNTFFSADDKVRLERQIRAIDPSVNIHYYSLIDMVSRIIRNDKKIIDAKVNVYGRPIEKGDGNVRALIADIDGRELIRIVSESEDLRNDASEQRHERLVNSAITEDAFYDNVRVYLKQKGKINTAIKKTALSDSNHMFFYYNNGVTIICSDFQYNKALTNPVVVLKNLQIVNGCQTVNSLQEAYKEAPDRFRDISVLCRIYATTDEGVGRNISEYTNSQNPVSSRDLRANDEKQKKLEAELQTYGYFYERKKDQYAQESKNKRIDAEKCAQSIMALFQDHPAEAKNNKKDIFGSRYDEVFSDQVTADHVILADSIMKSILFKKRNKRKEMIENEQLAVDYSFISYADFYMMYVLSLFADKKNIMLIPSNKEKILSFYDEALECIRRAVEQCKTEVNYSHNDYFKKNKIKAFIQKDTVLSKA